MSSASPAALAALRQTVRALEGEGRGHGRAALGDPGLDGLLPGGGLRLGAVHEVAPAAHFEGAAALGFALGLSVRALQSRAGAMAWIQPRRREFGAPYGPGLAGFGLAPERLWLVAPRKAQEALWATEEAVRAGLGAVLAELSEEAADLVAARRLQLAAEQSGACLVLLRPCGAQPATGACTRWRVAATTSQAPAWSAAALGPPRWRVRLERARGALGLQQDVQVEWRHATGGFHLVAPLAERAARAAGPPGGVGLALASRPALRAG